MSKLKYLANNVFDWLNKMAAVGAGLVKLLKDILERLVIIWLERTFHFWKTGVRIRFIYEGTVSQTNKGMVLQTLAGYSDELWQSTGGWHPWLYWLTGKMERRENCALCNLGTCRITVF